MAQFKYLIIAGSAALVALAGPRVEAQDAVRTCSQSHARCESICKERSTNPDRIKGCKEQSCTGLQACLNSGYYVAGNGRQFGPFEKK